MKLRTDALIASWSAHTPAPVKFRELAELARAIEAQHAAMLAALERITAGLNDEDDTRPLIKASEVRQARAAIAKARGEA